MTWRGARSSVSKSVTHGAQLANLPVQLLCLGRQNLSIYPKAPVRREHERYLILDHIWKPFEELLVEASSSASGGRILDVRCGAGTTTVAIARRLGTSGYLVGIDISSPLIALARSRAVVGILFRTICLR